MARMSRLHHWLRENGFTSAELEKEVAICRQSMTRIRGGADVRYRTMLRILRGCRRLARRDVRMEEIFDLDPDSKSNRESEAVATA